MGFSVEELRYSVCYPDEELLRSVTASSTMTTPKKIREVMGELVFPAAPADRPYTYGCMVLSFDGKMGFDNNPEGTLISKLNNYDPKGATVDFWMMNVCRCYADAVIFGCNTLKARMHKLWYAQLFDEDLLECRRELGKKTEIPVSILASIDGRDVPFDHATLSMTPAPVIMTSFAGAEYIRENIGREVRVITEPENLLCESDTVRILAAGEEKADTAALLKLLRDCGLEHVSVEAPGYIWTLMREGALDEYLLNYSGVMVGGNTALGLWGPFTAEKHPHAALLSLGYTKGFLFTRQKLLYD